MNYILYKFTFHPKPEITGLFGWGSDLMSYLCNCGISGQCSLYLAEVLDTSHNQKSESAAQGKDVSKRVHERPVMLGGTLPRLVPSKSGIICCILIGRRRLRERS